MRGKTSGLDIRPGFLVSDLPCSAAWTKSLNFNGLGFLHLKNGGVRSQRSFPFLCIIIKVIPR